MATLSNNFSEKTCKKVQQEYYCESCDYRCSRKFCWERHLSTSKHIEATNGNILATEKVQKVQKVANLCCKNCGKEYSDRTGLWRHKKKCNVTNNSNDNDSDVNEDISFDTKQLILTVIKQNHDLQNQIIELCKEKSVSLTNSQNTTHTNSHNKAFNLQFFLNETCKEAMNMTDFIDSLTLELSDLEDVGEKGYIEGISNIIVKNLKTLNVTERPVHCTDKKRETVYIKDNNIWEKDENKSKMHKLIKRIVSKNMNLLPKYKEKHPDCLAYHSKFNDQYHSIIYETMGGKGENEFEKNEKIIKNVLKEVVVKKADEQSVFEI